MLRTLAVLILLAACGSKSQTQLVDKAFPGFSVGLPGTTVASAANTYVAGSARVELRAGTESLRVQWQRTAQTELPATQVPVAPAGLPAYTTAAASGDDLIHTTIVLCDHRAVTLVSGFPKDTALAQHTAIVTSFRCTPVAGELDKPPVEILEPKLEKFTRHVQEQTALGFPTVTYQREDKEAVVVVQTRPDARLAHQLDLEAEMKKQLAGMTDIQIERKNDAVYFSAKNGAEPALGAAMAKRCDETAAYAFVVVMTTSRDIASEILDGLARNAACLPAPRS